MYEHLLNDKSYWKKLKIFDKIFSSPTSRISIFPITQNFDFFLKVYYYNLPLQNCFWFCFWSFTIFQKNAQKWAIFDLFWIEIWEKPRQKLMKLFTGRRVKLSWNSQKNQTHSHFLIFSIFLYKTVEW